jgi:hypothetical protein
VLGRGYDQEMVMAANDADPVLQQTAIDEWSCLGQMRWSEPWRNRRIRGMGMENKSDEGPGSKRCRARRVAEPFQIGL